ncbi:M48 family metallopeptidase [Formosa sp. S-31]|uniref:M48 family metallopeptidase n=1 Tax=Formosa sp. S-31 TaxID=2790949 RepID=UPI003EBA8F5A
MTKAIVAKYFDGQSSAIQKATLTFNGSQDALRLVTDGGAAQIWQLSDIRFEQYGDVLEIRNDKHSGAKVTVTDTYFSSIFYMAMKDNKRVDVHTRLLRLGFSKIIALAIGLLGVIALVYIYVLPPVAERSAALLPDSFDNEIGDVFTETFLEESDVDAEKSDYLEHFAGELDLGNTKRLRFAVVESEEVNAFALPNGQIVVFTGLLDCMDSADELAALLGHEASHVNKRHSTKMLCRNLAGYMMVSLLLSDVNGIMAVVAENAQQLHALSYSRKFEQEADEQGLKIMMDNQLNPDGMVELFEALDKAQGIAVPEIMSSHPLTKERKANMQNIISKSDYKIKSNSILESLFEDLKN